MKSFIVFLRGINVGGKNSLPMKELKKLLEALGCEQVQTYIQSGNCLLQSNLGREELAQSLKGSVQKEFGFSPDIFVLSPDELQDAIQKNPFQAEGMENPKSVHFHFLHAPVKSWDESRAALLKSPTESYFLSQQVFYLCAPEGIGRSKLAEKLPGLLPVSITARNFRTVMKMRDLATPEAG